MKKVMAAMFFLHGCCPWLILCKTCQNSTSIMSFSMVDPGGFDVCVIPDVALDRFAPKQWVSPLALARVHFSC